MDATVFAHGTPQFLPWHRWFMYFVETELRKINSSIAIPYWDWSYDAQKPLESPLFTAPYLLYQNGPRGDCSIRCTVS